jgi:hypothetical protein
MEQDFQTSFIPKKTVVEERASAPRSYGLFAIIAVIVFLTMVVSVGGLYLFKGITEKNIVKMENDLNLAKNRFEPSKIVQLQVYDKRLRSATDILSRHVAISPIFKALQDITMKTVRYTKFNYSLGAEQNPKVEVKMSGEGIGYKAIALQSDLFSQNKYFIDPIFYNLSLDGKGNVLFDLDFSVEPSFVDYQEVIRATTSGTFIPPSGEETTN